MKHNPIADDGDELHALVEHVGPFPEGTPLFREAERFDAIAAVRAGTVRTYVNDSEGREQVPGFFLPGEVIGLNAISQDRYPCNAVALDSVKLCRFSFPGIAALATRMPGVQQQLFKLLSHDIGKATHGGLPGVAVAALPPDHDPHRHRQLPAPRV
jgi:CRP/FNR family transcriptional regulator